MWHSVSYGGDTSVTLSGAASTTVALSPTPHLIRTLAHARMGNGDPCLQIIGDSVWRATRTPCGLATERLRLTPGGAVEVEAWGPGADWLLERAPALCGAFDTPAAFQPDQPLLRNLARRHPG